MQYPGAGAKCRQNGAVLLVLMLILTVGIASLLLASRNPRDPEAVRREQNAIILAQAREALLAWSLTRDGTVGTGNCSPSSSANGRACAPLELPCPANPNETAINSIGTSITSCNSAASPAARIGWLPWKTLGIPKLVDAYGEPLWYSVDYGFVVRTQDTEARKINSDSLSVLQLFQQGQEISAQGENPAALIFSAGPPIGNQLRNSPYAVAQYLEGAGAYSNATIGGPYVSASLADDFNDQIVVITGRELIDLAAARVGVAIATQLQLYYQAFDASYPGVLSAAMVAGKAGMTGANSAAVAAAAVVDYADASICRQLWLAAEQYSTGMMVSTSPGNSGNFYNYTAATWSQGIDPAQGNPSQWNKGASCAMSCAAAWTANGRNSGGTAYLQNDVASYGGQNWQAIYQIGIGGGAPSASNSEWESAGACSGSPAATASPTPAPTATPSPLPVITPTPTPLMTSTPSPSASPSSIPAPYPYPADILGDSSCRDNNLYTSSTGCRSKVDLCTGVLPRAQYDWTGQGRLPVVASDQLPTWFKQNIWHRAILYSVKQGNTCTSSFVIDGVTDNSIDALFILPGAARVTRANNLVLAANASTDLSLYLEDVSNQNKWLSPTDRQYVTPSCTSNDVLYTCRQGVCSERKRQC
ncbi:hypothetical protein HZU75_05335 [Chitinibacter fontanus]|uniref:Uncharacterized protein n=1 Tax=Chitinibacter fontanus TaxID=1737446 RepID=A0A7D5V988_9NEIS|nr:hypothetical protein [Chitinibacter fontanus]QLI80992.1 hypothetical protein HZU75_05335 [Chitinibacter fontanus]